MARVERLLEDTLPDLDLFAAALAAELAQPWADVVLSGAATVEQLESNLAEEPERYWDARSELDWDQRSSRVP
jgi:aryl-alcohol dehydrogenase-like predicted oxidoreductase